MGLGHVALRKATGLDTSDAVLVAAADGPDGCADADVYLPRFVWRELEGIIACGDVHRGFVRVVCQSCKHERVLGFSCKVIFPRFSRRPDKRADMVGSREVSVGSQEEAQQGVQARGRSACVASGRNGQENS